MRILPSSRAGTKMTEPAIEGQIYAAMSREIYVRKKQLGKESMMGTFKELFFILICLPLLYIKMKFLTPNT